MYSNVKFFKTICRADEEDLKDAVIKSPSARMLADELYSGEFSVALKLAETIGAGNGDLQDKRITMIHYSLSDVELYEIPLGANSGIYRKLMAREECNNAVMANIYAGGYICQGQQIMEATVEYNLTLGEESAASAEVKADAVAVRQALKVSGAADSSVELIEKEGRLVTGTSLKYGVAMNPTCMAPPHARFERILPKSDFGRFVNFVKFHILEPILPGT